MAKIQLGKPPATFSHTVRFPLVGGGEGDIKVEYAYRTRKEYAAFIDTLYPEIKAPPKVSTRARGAGIDLEAEADKGIGRDVDHILGAVRSWDLDDAFDAASVKRLVNEFPAAADQIIADYKVAITEGRTGN